MPHQPKNKYEDRVLIMGIGNYLMGDEGIGVHVVEYFQHSWLPDYVDLLDGGTGGFHLLEYFEKYDKVILIDATLDNRPAGTIRLIQPKFASDFPKAMSTHDIGLKDMMSSLQLLGKVPEIFLYVVSIETIQQQGIELTDQIKQTVPHIVKMIRNLLQDISNPVAV